MYVHTFIFLLAFPHKFCVLVSVGKELLNNVGVVPHLEMKAHWVPTRYFLAGFKRIKNLRLSFCWEIILHGSLIFLYNLQEEALSFPGCLYSE